MTTKFLNCPFCGSNQICEPQTTNFGYAVICAICFAQGPAEREEAEAVKFWNERNTWLDISSAPRDGTEILAKNTSGIQRVVKWGDVSMGGTKGWQVAVIATDWNYYEELEDVISWKPLE